MARSDYHDFLDEARDVFGLSYSEAQDFYRDMRDVLGYTPGPSDLREYGDLASDLLEPVFEAVPLPLDVDDVDDFVDSGEPRDITESWSDDEGDDDFDYGADFDRDTAGDIIGDEWYEPGDEVELSADLTYEGD